MGNSNSGSARADDDGSGTGAPAPGRVVLHPPDTRPPPLVSPNPLTYIVVGAGNRGSIYGMYGGEQPGLARVVGVAEPQPGRRALFAETHDIDPGTFSWCGSLVCYFFRSHFNITSLLKQSRYTLK